MTDSRPTTPPRILVVDDNQDSAKSLAMLLKISGYETFCAHDGQEAIDEAARLRPQFILLDIGLPRLSGIAVCAAIRKEPWGQNMQIIALTGRNQEEDRQASQAAGFNGHLVKPVELATLTALLKAARSA